MRKQIGVLAVVALLAAACTDDGAKLTSPDELSFTRGISGPTWVDGFFSLDNGGGSFAPGQNAHPQGLGTCRDAGGNIGDTSAHTTWYNPAGHWTNAKFCEGTSGGELFCTIGDLAATYALGSENENLNFELDESADPDATDLFVHYRTQQNDTRGLGVLAISYDCGGDITGNGTINLEGFFADPGNLFGGFGAGRQVSSEDVEVVTQHGTGTGATLHWFYRCRAGGQVSSACFE